MFNNSDNQLPTNITLNNASNNAAIRAYVHQQLLTWIIAVLVTNGFGTITNFILLFAMVIHRPLRRSSSSPLIAHSIVIDLYNTAISVPTTTIPLYLGPSRPVVRHFCRYQPLLIQSMVTAGMYAACMLALHRLIATVFPRHFVKATGKRLFAVAIAVPWLVTFGINLPIVLRIGTKFVRSNTTGNCHYELTGSSTQPIFFATLFGTYLPTIFMGFCYGTVLVQTLINGRRKQSSVARRRREISLMLVLSFIWHLITLCPHYIMITFFRVQYDARFALQLGFGWLITSYSAINPLFFFATSRLFQDGVKKVLTGRWFATGLDDATNPQSGAISATGSAGRRKGTLSIGDILPDKKIAPT